MKYNIEVEVKLNGPEANDSKEYTYIRQTDRPLESRCVGLVQGGAINWTRRVVFLKTSC